jgi:hypothetical protein
MNDKNSKGSTMGKSLMTRREVLKAAGAAGVMASVPASMIRTAFGATPAKRLTFAVPAGPQSIEPHLEGADIWQRRKPLIYENLVWVDYDMQPKPQLATSWEMTNPTTYLFHAQGGQIPQWEGDDRGGCKVQLRSGHRSQGRFRRPGRSHRHRYHRRGRQVHRTIPAQISLRALCGRPGRKIQRGHSQRFCQDGE